ncbi:MAG: type I pantothenate kinase [Promicromonosporaceae bacterium]|nr:type I pantothenate kinase [Promicromonosporaceae bacterium]
MPTARPAAPASSANPAGPASHYVDLDRSAWQRLSSSTPLPLTDDDVRRLRGLGDPMDLAEVDAIYRPLSRLLNLYVAASQSLHSATSTFLHEIAPRTPYVIGVSGSVAVGKSTVARILPELMARWPDTPHVELVTTDGFLLPNAELTKRRIFDRKGFPESYDRKALIEFVRAVKSGQPEVTAPVYSHVTYDIMPGEQTVVRKPDVLIVEGINVLQPGQPLIDGGPSVSVSDFFDFSIYVDAATADIKRWYIERFLALRATAFAKPDSYFRRYAALSDEQAVAQASEIWEAINAPNLEENIRPTRGRATLVLSKGADHSLRRVRLRKL